MHIFLDKLSNIVYSFVMQDNVTISLVQLMRQFPNDEAARLHFEEKRWGDGIVCPHCGGSHKIYPVSRKNSKGEKVNGYYECGECRKVFTVRTGTVMERSHIPLQFWLIAFYLDVTERKGISSMQLSKHLGITQKSAWFMLGRIRTAAQKGVGLLGGVVEADATYIGGRESNKHESKKQNLGRGTVGKTPVLGLRSRSGKVVARVLADTKQETVHAVLNEVLEDDAMLVTDEHKAYKDTKFLHKSVNHSVKEYKRGGIHTNGIESVWAVLKRAYHGVYHGFSTKHIQLYVNEVAFRLNDANVNVHVETRMNRLWEGCIGKRITYKELIADAA